MSFAKALYHRLVPEKIRNPIGLARRDAADAVRRRRNAPIPPPELLLEIQMTPWADEYLEMGRRAATTVRMLLDSHGIGPGAHVLDFGCGPGRTIRHLVSSGWSLQGCDVDRDAIEWSSGHLPAAEFSVTGARPPLPFDSASFDALYSIAVFTRFDEPEQLAWGQELARILRPGGLAVISTMSEAVIGNFPAHATPDNLLKLRRDGFVFIPASGDANAGVFHSPAGLIRLFPDFELFSWLEQGLDTFQDAALLRRK